MSHFAKIQVNFKFAEEASLIAALELAYGKGSVTVHEQPVHPRLWGGQDSKSYTGDLHAEPCHIIVDRKAATEHGGGLSNDLGFRRNNDGGYDTWLDKSGWTTELSDQVMEEYSAKISTRELELQGYSVQRSRQEDGSLLLRAEAW
jgi:hypothetical protein